MGDMPPVTLPYLQVFRSRGKRYAYYRRDGRQVRILAATSDPNFAAAYEDARKRWEGTNALAPKSTATAGTIAYLIEAYRAAPEYKKLAAKTQRDYGRLLDLLKTRFGAGPIDKANRTWVYRLRDEMQDKPRTANLRVAIIGALFRFGIDRGLATDNPATRVAKLETGEGFRTWTDAELAVMTDSTAGDVALPVLLARYTAQRQGDVLRLPWSAYDGQSITLRQSKTGAMLTVPVPEELRAVLDAITPRPGLLICLTADNRAWTSGWFGKRFARVRDQAGLPTDLHFHGLRATRLTELAEAGASEAELMANSGHRTTQMVGRYTRAARQKGLAAAGVARLPKRKANAESV